MKGWQKFMVVEDRRALLDLQFLAWVKKIRDNVFDLT